MPHARWPGKNADNVPGESPEEPQREAKGLTGAILALRDWFEA